MAEQIVLNNVFKIFGSEPQKALALAKQGVDKQQIFERTGQSIGVFDANLTINEGEVFVIMGLSGSGKSTLVRLLNRLIKPTFGSIWINGEDIAKVSNHRLREIRRKDISMVFQSFALMPHLNVRDNVAFGLKLAGINKASRLAMAESALDQVGLSGWGDSYPEELSGGMQQRVGLARALSTNPKILLMDEAFSALDPIIRVEMQMELLRLQETQRRTVVFISHDLDESIRIADRIAIMKDGEIIQIGSAEEIITNPADDYVRRFVRGADKTAVFKAGDIARKTLTEIIYESPVRGCRAALQVLEDHDREYAVVLTPTKKYLGMVSADSLRAALNNHSGLLGLQHAFLEDSTEAANISTAVSDLYGYLANAAHAMPITDDDGRYQGVVSRTTMLKFLHQTSVEKELEVVDSNNETETETGTEAGAKTEAEAEAAV